jgi:hypothetical protein
MCQEQTSSICFQDRLREKLSETALIIVTFCLSAAMKYLVSFSVDLSYEFYIRISYIDLKFCLIYLTNFILEYPISILNFFDLSYEFYIRISYIDLKFCLIYFTNFTLEYPISILNFVWFILQILY